MTDGEYDNEEKVDGDDGELLSGEVDGSDEVMKGGSRNTLWSIDGIMEDYDISEEAFDEGVLEQLKVKEWSQ